MHETHGKIWAAVLGSITIGLVGCGGDPNRSSAVLAPKIGRQCTVQLRRNLLGTASSSGISPLAGSVNGVEFSVAGTLAQATDSWIILSSGQREYCIPRDNILLLDVSSK
jgi:hypothetical protein